jgi:hypothetical protein
VATGLGSTGIESRGAGTRRDLRKSFYHLLIVKTENGGLGKSEELYIAHE